jgi:hypothetical protein
MSEQIRWRKFGDERPANDAGKLIVFFSEWNEIRDAYYEENYLGRGPHLDIADCVNPLPPLDDDRWIYESELLATVTDR